MRPLVWALPLVLLALTRASTVRGDDAPDPAVTELLEDYAPERGRPGAQPDRPLRSTTLSVWIARHLAVPRAAVAHMPARGARGELRWRVRQRRTRGITTTYVWRDTGGDCPSTERIVLQHDARGRLGLFRRLAETCEGVDPMFHEERFSYDARGRLREVVRSHLRRPIDVHELEELDLTDDLTLPDGSMPPTWDPPARCTFVRESDATRVICGDERDPVQVTRSLAGP